MQNAKKSICMHFFCAEKSVNMTNILADCTHQAQKNRKKRKKIQTLWAKGIAN